MGQAQKVLNIGAADWGAVLAGWLALCFDDPAALAGVARQVESGRATAFAADYDGEIVGAFVLRVDGDEGVIVAAAGDLDGVSLVPLLLRHIEGRFNGCRAIRFHTVRPGLARVMAEHGYKGQEVVMRKDLS